MSYTPQAGDVIESPDKKTRYVLAETFKDYADNISQRIVRVRWTKKDGWLSVGRNTSSNPPEYYAALVNCMGWTLVSRKEVQDGNRD